MSIVPTKNSTGRAGELWPVLLLLVVVAVPTIGVLWFVSLAIENQQLATKQRLTDAYRSHLLNIQKQIDADWQQVAEQVANIETQMSARELFAEVINLGLADSVVCYSDSGQVQYPTLSEEINELRTADLRWTEARREEDELGNLRAANSIYESIAVETNDASERMLAIQAQVRCLLKAKDDKAATELVINSLDHDQVVIARRDHTRSVEANIELMAIEHIRDGEDYERILDRLSKRVRDYGDALPASQRLFLMKRLAQIAPDRVNQRMLEAEDLAASYVAAHPTQPKTQSLQRSQVPQVWYTVTPGGRTVLLLKSDSVMRHAGQAVARVALPSDVDFKVLPPSAAPPQKAEFLSLSAGTRLPGWRLSVFLQDGQQIDSAVVQRNSVYLWTGILVVLFTSVLGIFIARAFRRQLHVANLKNDLVGTVSHELKTPLSSMRMLVDTLLDEDTLDEETTREYLQLIAKENLRLSRLIENFLAFSRMEHNRHSFEFEKLSIAEIVSCAVEAAGERLREPNCSLTIEVDDDLPMVHGDKDGLVTVLLNLLDNAYKYSPADPQIEIRASGQNGSVFIAITDNGIGLPRTATRRVFQRFYQVDQRLVRQGRGCGLGLSIVDYIVRAHHGTVGVTSRLGKGSTFRVTLPVADKPAVAMEVKP